MRGFSFASWGLSGPRGFFQNPGELAIQMVVFAPMSLYFLLGIKQWLKRWQIYVLATMPVTAALTVLGTNTRGGQLALAAQVLALVLVSRHRFKALLSVALISAIGYQVLPEEQKARFESMGDDGTSRQRIFYLKHGWQMMKEHPILGVGYFNFSPYYTQHHSEDLIGKDRAELPHNIFIQVGTDTGFTGLGLFLLLILGGFLSMRRLRIVAERRGDIFFAQMARGMNLALLGYVVAGQFVTVAYYPYLWIHLALCVAMAQAQHLEGRRGAPKAMTTRPAVRSPLVGSMRT
jgi:putative inorganic carbon (hco3(-)) transporter